MHRFCVNISFYFSECALEYNGKAIWESHIFFLRNREAACKVVLLFHTPTRLCRKSRFCPFWSVGGIFFHFHFRDVWVLDIYCTFNFSLMMLNSFLWVVLPFVQPLWHCTSLRPLYLFPVRLFWLFVVQILEFSNIIHR